MLNAVGLQNVGVRAFVAEKLPVLRKFDTAIIANVFGYALDDYVDVLQVLEDADGLAGYDLNISCPNVKRGGMQFGSDPVCVANVVGAARKAAIKRPLWVKLSPLVTDIGLIARAAAEAGADALTVANTYPAMALDCHRRVSICHRQGIGSGFRGRCPDGGKYLPGDGIGLPDGEGPSGLRNRGSVGSCH